MWSKPSLIDNAIQVQRWWNSFITTGGLADKGMDSTDSKYGIGGTLSKSASGTYELGKYGMSSKNVTPTNCRIYV